MRGTGAIDAAEALAFEDAANLDLYLRGGPLSRVRPPVPFRRRLAVGDPQAPLHKFLELLDRRGLLSEEGRLRDDVQLVSMGDHFDWGRSDEREDVAQQSCALFAWLCAHPAEQVIVLLGNHDLARVCELYGWRSRDFEAARVEAAEAWRQGEVDPRAEEAFLERYPMFPTAELLARDYASFHPMQTVLVRQALDAGRVQLAHADDAHTLLLHAGIHVEQLEALGLGGPEALGDAPAQRIADRLNGLLRERWAQRGEGPLDLRPLHVPGSASTGEGVGMFFHRAAHPSLIEDPPGGRRFDPRVLPMGLVQVVGHVRHGKSRKLLGPWAEGEDVPVEDGPLRQLTVTGERVHYAVGLRKVPVGADAAAMIFTDGGMHRTPPARYELLDLDARLPA